MKMPKCNHCEKELDKDEKNVKFEDLVTGKEIWYCQNCKELLKNIPE